MRVVFAGTPATAVSILDALLDSDHDVVAVVTRPDAPAGRGRKVAPSAVRERALEAGLEVLTPQRPSEPDFLARLTAIDPDVCAVVAYGALLPTGALVIPRHGWVNLHFSLLPAWRGAAPVQHAILAGDDVTGATTFRIEESLDTGPVFGVLTTDIGPRETAGDLLGRLAHDGAGLMVSTLDAIAAGDLSPVPQSADGVSYAPKLTTSDARIDWESPSLRVDRLVRACTPSPGAWTTFRGRRLRLGPVRPLAGPTVTLAPGQVHDRGKDGVLVGTGGGVVELGYVQPEGKASVPADAWARGARLSAEDRLA
jgi:methionyl-tRNA formyltransferase